MIAAGVPVDTKNAREIGKKLIAWYREAKRNLPWRETKDPYKIWVSEVMLQQTRVETVIPYWERFIKRFPTVSELADAEEDEVLKHWEGLGYYSRVRNLQAAVREVSARYGGEIPQAPAEFSKLPGVGPYTTGAVLSIAYDVDIPAVDGNVFRVLSRLFLIDEDIARPKTRAVFEALAAFLIPAGFASDFNQALMELGATICIPKHPRCERCPVRQECIAYEEGMQSDLPVKGKKAPPRETLMYAVIVDDGQGNYAIRQRPDKGLLANMWEFPTWAREEASIEDYSNLLGLGEMCFRQPLRPFADIEHIFSHLHWKVSVWRGSVTQTAGKTEGSPTSLLNWISVEEMEKLSLSGVHLKMKRLLGGLV